MVPLYGAQVDQLVQVSDERDALLFRFLAQAEGIPTGQPLPSMNQGQVGSCVGFGTARAGSVVAACDIYHRHEDEEYHRWCGEAIYAIGRQVANQLGGGDGSTGAWSIAGIRKLGTLHYYNYGSFDLTGTGNLKAREWANRGVPAEYLEEAAKYKVIAAYRLNNTDELKAALQNGYAAIICANIGYANVRDRDGFARRQGQWAHCMAIIAYRGLSSGREGFLISNSWAAWNSGGVWPEDQPEGSMWVTPQDAQAHLSAGDSWIIAGYEGFKKRELPWKEVLSRTGGIRDGRDRTSQGSDRSNRYSRDADSSQFVLSP